MEEVNGISVLNVEDVTENEWTVYQITEMVANICCCILFTDLVSSYTYKSDTVVHYRMKVSTDRLHVLICFIFWTWDLLQNYLLETRLMHSNTLNSL